MAGIAGVDRGGQAQQVETMLQKIHHRGRAGSKVIEHAEITLGAVWPAKQDRLVPEVLSTILAWDGASPPIPDCAGMAQDWRPAALASIHPDGLFLARSPFGECPLYYGFTSDQALCFASEAKALLDQVLEIYEFPPGVCYHKQTGFQPFYAPPVPKAAGKSPDGSRDDIRLGLRLRIEQAVTRRISSDVIGCWLSGDRNAGLLAALLKPYVNLLYCFSVGLPGSPELIYSERLSQLLQVQHVGIETTEEQIVQALPEVIYYLESFHPPQVQTALAHFLAAQVSVRLVDGVFAGEGFRHLFTQKDGGEPTVHYAGPRGTFLEVPHLLPASLSQPAERSASALGLIAHFPFLDRQLIEYASGIPPSMLPAFQAPGFEQWIWDQVVDRPVPGDILSALAQPLGSRTGFGPVLASLAEESIRDSDFQNGRHLPNGQIAHTKEELMYYRIYYDHFGDRLSLELSGRLE